MKKFLLTLFAIVSIGSQRAITPTKAEDKPSAPPAGYLLLDKDLTKQAWIRGIDWDDRRDGVEISVAPIIFFDANPKYEINEVLSINYQISPVGKAKQFGTISQNGFHEIVYHSERKSSLFDKERTITTTNHEYIDNRMYVENPEKETEVRNTKAEHITVNKIFVPQVGKTSVLERDLAQYIGSKSTINHLSNKLYYKTIMNFVQRTEPFNYEGLNTSWGFPNKKYYLIIPLDTIDYTIDYLSIRAITQDGTIIDDRVNITTDPVTKDMSFELTKVNGKLISHEAVFFPGNNFYYLKKIERLSYQELENPKELKAYVYAGNLVGQKTIDAIKDGIARGWVISDNPISTSYEFMGFNNSIMVDIPDVFTDIKIKITFAKIDPEAPDSMMPFGQNLLDQNGNFGIRGANPPTGLDGALNTNSFWDWLTGLFNFGGMNLFGKVGNVLQIAAVAVIGVGILFIALKVLQFLGSIFGKK